MECLGGFCCKDSCAFLTCGGTSISNGKVQSQKTSCNAKGDCTCSFGDDSGGDSTGNIFVGGIIQSKSSSTVIRSGGAASVAVSSAAVVAAVLLAALAAAQ